MNMVPRAVLVSNYVFLPPSQLHSNWQVYYLLLDCTRKLRLGSCILFSQGIEAHCRHCFSGDHQEPPSPPWATDQLVQSQSNCHTPLHGTNTTVRQQPVLCTTHGLFLATCIPHRGVSVSGHSVTHKVVTNFRPFNSLDSHPPSPYGARQRPGADLMHKTPFQSTDDREPHFSPEESTLEKP